MTLVLLPAAALATDDISVSGQTYGSGTSVVAAERTITTAGTVEVPSGADVMYAAGTSITLGAGFKVDAGGIFSAAAGPVFISPSTPGGFALGAVGSDFVNLSWSAATSPTGAAISGYQIYRNGALIATVAGTALSYNDTTVGSGLGYTYYVRAIDAEGVQSPATTSISTDTAGDLELFTPLL